MLFALAVIVAIVAVIVALREPHGQRIRAVDPSDAYAAARRVASFDVRTPNGLTEGWRPTSARSRSEGGHVTLEVGFVTPKGEYAQLVESDLPRDQLLTQELTTGVRATGSVTVAGRTWERFPGGRAGDRAIARTEGRATYLVHGSADLGELTLLAASIS